MIVSHEHRFIFLKTRKTAGTSIEVFLAPLAGDDAIVTPVADIPTHPVRNADRPIRRYRSLLAGSRLKEMQFDVGRKRWFYNHLGARLIRARIGPRKWNSYFKFCFERDPWDKTISFYYYDFASRKQRPAFRDYVMTGALPCDFDRYTLDHRNIAVDFVGRYEHLDDDLRQVLREIGIDAPIALTREKGAVRPPDATVGAMYDVESSARVAEVFAREIAAFGYRAPILGP